MTLPNMYKTNCLSIPNFVEKESHIFFLKTNLVIIYFTKILISTPNIQYDQLPLNP